MNAPPLIPDHTLLRPIGRGAYGEVWLARNVMGVLRAVKIIWRRDFDNQRPYDREFAGIQRYEPVSRSSTGLVHMLHVGRNDAEGYFFYVMELADAAEASVATPPASIEPGEKPHRMPDTETPDAYRPRTLRSELDRLGRLPPADCVRVAIDVVAGLAELHRHGLVHRDVKPGNVIYVHGHAKLADIGLVSAGGEGRTFVGTEGYIPPEGPGSPSADLYALGIALYEASTGNSPEKFPDLPVEWLANDADNEVLEFHEIILKACEGQRERRYQSAEAMQADLALLQSGRSLRRVRALEQRYARLRVSGVVGTLLLVCAVVAVVFANYRAKLAAESRATEARLRDEAQTSLGRAEKAERDARQQLYTALLGEARAVVRSGELGQRTRALDTLRLAAAISKRAELRREVFAALALPDLRFDQELDIGTRVTLALCDPAFERMAICRGSGPTEIRSLKSAALIASLPASSNRWAYGGMWSADGRFLAIKRDVGPGGRRTDWEVWDVPSSRRQMLVHDLPRTALAFLPGAQQLLSAGQGAVTRWDLATGQVLSRLPMKDEPQDLVCSPTGDCYAARFEIGDAERVAVFNISNGTVLASWDFDEHVANVRWHPSGRCIGVADSVGRIQLLDWRSGETKELGRHKAYAATLAFSPEGNYLISGGWEREMICWDLRTFTRAFTIAIDSYHLQFSADGRRCMTLVRSAAPEGYFQECKLHVFERPSACRDFPEDLGMRVDQATFSSDGHWVAASGQNRVGVWKLDDNSPGALSDVDSDAMLYFAPDASELFGSSREGRWLRWRIKQDDRQNALNPAPVLQPVAVTNTPGGNWLCAASNLVVWTCRRGSRVSTFGQPEDELSWKTTATGVTGASPDAQWLGVHRAFGEILHIYHLPSLEAVAHLTNRARISTIHFSSRRDEVAVSTRQGIEFWGTTRWERKRELTNFMDLLYAPDARTFWLTKDFRTAGLYEAETLESLLPLPTSMLPLAISPDGRSLAVSVDLRRLQVWDLVEVRRQLRELGLDWPEDMEPTANRR